MAACETISDMISAGGQVVSLHQIFSSPDTAPGPGSRTTNLSSRD